MLPSSTRCAEPRVVGPWETLARHQTAAILATIIDFGTMVVWVECLHGSPVAGTAVGATVGGVTNFCLGRAWIFRSTSGALAAQGLRYAVVSAASAGWNALGEHVVHDRAHVQYVMARMLVAFAVSLLWNFPLQRYFVFREDKAK